MELSELHLHGRLFMWSNEKAHPTLLKFDRVFACVAWCDIFPHHHLRVGSSSRSDHTPLLLSTNVNSVAKKRFCFKSIWSKFPGYDFIASAWQGDVPNVDAFHTFDCKFQHTAIALKSWSAKYVGNIHMQLAVAKKVIFQFDKQQERRQLSAEELALCKERKAKCLGLTSLQRCIVQ
jgi:hypothetical protein